MWNEIKAEEALDFLVQHIPEFICSCGKRMEKLCSDDANNRKVDNRWTDYCRSCKKTLRDLLNKSFIK